MKIFNNNKPVEQTKPTSRQEFLKKSALVLVISGIAICSIKMGINYILQYEHDEFVRQVGHIVRCSDEPGVAYVKEDKVYESTFALLNDKILWMTGYLVPHTCIPLCNNY